MFVSCGKLNAEVADLQAQIDALAAGATPDATETVKGKVELATLAEVASGAPGALAVTPDKLVAALNDAAGPNALQSAVANAIEKSIAGDTGAQAAIANAIVEEVVAALGFKDCDNADIAVGAALATCQNLSDAIAAIPDATDTVKGKVSLAVAANAPSTSDTEAATPAFVNAAIAAAAPTGAETKVTAGTNVTVSGTGTTADPYVVNASQQTAQQVATAIAGDATAQSTLAGALADDLGATAAETIAGTVSTKFVSPDDLSAALQAGADYPIEIIGGTAASEPRFLAQFKSRRAGTNSSVAVWGEYTADNSGGYGGFFTRNGVLGGAASNVPVVIATDSATMAADATEANALVGQSLVAGKTSAQSSTGVLAEAVGSGGTNIGLRARALNGDTNWAGYFEGDVNVTGKITGQGATAAETIAGTVDNTFVSPADLSAALQGYVEYPIGVVGTASREAVYGEIATGPRSAVVGYNNSATGDSAAVSGRRDFGGATVIGRLGYVNPASSRIGVFGQAGAGDFAGLFEGQVRIVGLQDHADNAAAVAAGLAAGDLYRTGSVLKVVI